MPRKKLDAGAAASVDPASAIEHWPIDKVLPYARNARLHSDEQVAQIAASMKEFGWTIPCVVDEQGMLIAGHARILAARKVERPTVPVVVARGWSEAKKRAYCLLDNKSTLNGQWDVEMLSAELADLVQEPDLNIAIIGFGDDELRTYLAGWAAMPEEVDGVEEDGSALSSTIKIECSNEDAVPLRKWLAEFLPDSGVRSAKLL